MARTKGSKNRPVATNQKLIEKLQNAKKLLAEYRLPSEK